jgi:hypothetical protein
MAAWRRAGQSQAPLSCAAPSRHAVRVASARTLGLTKQPQVPCVTPKNTKSLAGRSSAKMNAGAGEQVTWLHHHLAASVAPSTILSTQPQGGPA